MNFGRLFALSHQLVLVIPSEVEESLETILCGTILPVVYEVSGIISALSSAPI
jgi:hypothetical protein